LPARQGEKTFAIDTIKAKKSATISGSENTPIRFTTLLASITVGFSQAQTQKAPIAIHCNPENAKATPFKPFARNTRCNNAQ